MADDDSTAIHAIDRRSLLRAGLLAGFGLTAVSGTSMSLAGTARAATAQPDSVTPPGGSSQQFNWAWCDCCCGLFYTQNSNFGICPATGDNGASDVNPHADILDYSSYDYGVFYNGSGTDWQPYWCWCSQCQGLFWGIDDNHTVGGICPYKKGVGAHVGTGSLPYLMYHGSSSLGQTGWYWCQNCSGIFFGGTSKTAGWCPVYGGGKQHHDGSTSWTYQIASSGWISLGPPVLD
jgi:hypothetical protein